MEEFDLLDKNRNLTGEKMVRGDKVPAGRYRQVIHIAIFNSDGKMLIQQRQSIKSSFPNFWDISVGGCVRAGEEFWRGAERELFEEIGVKYNFSDTRPAITAYFETGFDDYFILNMDLKLEELILQDSEVKAVKWATLDEILKMQSEKIFIPYHDGLIELLFSLKNSHYGFVRY